MCYKCKIKSFIETYDRPLYKTIQGPFVLTINDLLEISEIFKPYRIEAIELDYSVVKDKIIVGKEH